MMFVDDGDDDVDYYICWRLKLEGETENSGGHRHEGGEGRSVWWKFAAVSWSGAGGRLMLETQARILLVDSKMNWNWNG